jgi:hypothetical protein
MEGLRGVALNPKLKNFRRLASKFDHLRRPMRVKTFFRVLPANEPWSTGQKIQVTLHLDKLCFLNSLVQLDRM